MPTTGGSFGTSPIRCPSLNSALYPEKTLFCIWVRSLAMMFSIDFESDSQFAHPTYGTAMFSRSITRANQPA